MYSIRCIPSFKNKLVLNHGTCTKFSTLYGIQNYHFVADRVYTYRAELLPVLSYRYWYYDNRVQNLTY